MIQFLLLISRHGKTRMNKYYRHYTHKERQNIQKEVSLAIVICKDRHHDHWQKLAFDTFP